MIYLKTFKLSDVRNKNTNIHPYNIFRGKEPDVFVFENITVLYGNNGAGKSTILNLIAHKLNLKGKERVNVPVVGVVPYFEEFAENCTYTLGMNELGMTYKMLPSGSRYIKSEEILYEIRKLQQDAVLQESVESNLARERGLKNAKYLLDEPEVSLSPQNQVELAKKINEMARLLGVQFIIATHSPFMLGILNAKIYNLDTDDYKIQKWSELENVRYFYDFFKSKENEFWKKDD